MIYKQIRTQLMKQPFTNVHQLNNIVNVTCKAQKMSEIDEQFKQNIEQLVNTASMVKNMNAPDCSICKWSDKPGQLCCYAALHPLQPHKSRAPKPIDVAVRSCPGFEPRI